MSQAGGRPQPWSRLLWRLAHCAQHRVWTQPCWALPPFVAPVVRVSGLIRSSCCSSDASVVSKVCSSEDHCRAVLVCVSQHGPGCCCSSVAESCLTFCDPMDCSTPGLSVPHHIPVFAQVHVHCIGDAISSPDALFSFCPQSFPASGTFPVNQLFSIRWPKYWSFDFSISPSNEYSGLMSLKINWFDLLAVQGTLKSLLRHHSLKASILQHSAFFTVHLS